MSGSETGCGDGEELGLEAAADAGGLTNFSKEIEGRRESRYMDKIQGSETSEGLGKRYKIL